MAGRFSRGINYKGVWKEYGMNERLLCSICVSFLVVQSLLMLMTGGRPFLEVPASSIFYNMEESRNILLKGKIYKKADTSKNLVLYLQNNSIYDQNNSFYAFKIIVYLDKTEYDLNRISIGETIYIQGQLEPFEEARNPGNFDQKLYYAKENLRGFVWCEEIKGISGETDRFAERLYRLKQTWKEMILNNMSENTGGVLSAILLSEKSEMDAQVKELYQTIGIGHVLAISGLHISFIGLGIYQLLRKSGLPYIAAGLLALSLLTGYVVMVGFSVSVIRAYSMLLFRILADVTGRVYDILTAVAFSATVTVLYQPLALMDAAFYLSYGAICGIVLVKPQIEKIIPQKNRLVRGSMASLAINITLFPVMLWFYYEFSTYSIVMNLVVIPLMNLVLGLGFCGSVGVVICYPLGKICFMIVDLILQFYEFLGEIGSRLPLSTIVFGEPEWYEVCFYYVVLVCILIFLNISKNESTIKKGRKYICFAAFAACIMFCYFPNGKMQVSFLDVGQGDSIFIRGPFGHTYLIDGGSSDVKQVGKYRIEPFLKSQGVGSLDYVFVSHGDADHYNGIAEMIERQKTGVRIKQLVFPANYQNDENLLYLMEVALDQRIKISVIEKDKKLQEGDMEIVCLQPQMEEQGLEGNAGSMVLSISMGNFDLLCTGDVEMEGEERLCKRLGERQYDVLKVAHHGSKNSTKEEFLQIVKPRLAVISAGQDNSYGHPHKETMNRLRQVGSTILQTKESGAIMLESDGDFIDILESCL